MMFEMLTHKSAASNLLSEIGLEAPKQSIDQSPLRHVGQRAKKIPLNKRRVRKVKRTSRVPPKTRTRPAVGHERGKETFVFPHLRPTVKRDNTAIGWVRP